LKKIAGGTDPDERGYAVFCDPHRGPCGGLAVTPRCECKGFVRWGHCKHADSVGVCVVNGWL
jgi:hypothetical protein